MAKPGMHISDIDYANDNTMNLSLEDREKLALTRYVKSLSHSGFPCINFDFEIMIPKKGSKPKNLIKQTIYRWF